MRQRFKSFGDEAASQIIEFGLVLLPMMAVLFLIMDVAWICFAQASLQHAVEVGARTAVTGYLPTGTSGQDSYIKSVVQDNAMGFLAGQDGFDTISVAYYAPTNLSKAATGLGSNAGGNVVEVTVKNVPIPTLGPILRETWATVYMKASASDVMESSPNGIPPAR